MEIPELKSFALVGGTALSLRYGHRESVDLDLFSSENFENEFIANAIAVHFPTAKIDWAHNSIGVFAYIDGVKVDLVNYSRYSLIGGVEMVEGLRIVSDKDLIAMKTNAILRRAVKKDFWDIAELLQYYTIQNFIEFYIAKYPTQMLLISVPQAISYFEDAESSEAPVSLKGQTWESVKDFIKKKVRDFLI